LLQTVRQNQEAQGCRTLERIVAMDHFLTMDDNANPSANRQPVDRTRRFRFVAVVVGFSLLSATGVIALMALGLTPEIYFPLIEMYMSGMFSIATATSIGYITGSVVDYNGGVGNMFRRRSSRRSDYATPDDYEAQG
jgi:hypothetical protein